MLPNTTDIFTLNRKLLLCFNCAYTNVILIITLSLLTIDSQYSVPFVLRLNLEAKIRGFHSKSFMAQPFLILSSPNFSDMVRICISYISLADDMWRPSWGHGVKGQTEVKCAILAYFGHFWLISGT